MLATCFSNRTAKVILLLVVVQWAQGPAAEAASPTAGQWQRAGVGGSKQALDDNVWRLPNGHLVPSGTEATSSVREPRELSAPADAQPLAAGQTASPVKRTTGVQKHTSSAAVTQTAATVPGGRAAHGTSRPGSRQTGIPHVARAMPPSRSGMMNPNTARLQQRMNVASNASEWSGGAEDLPLPGNAGKAADTSDPFGTDPEGYYVDGGEPYFDGGPGCEDGSCEEVWHGGCACGDGCECGGACEPGCGCGCGDGECQSCINDCCAIGPGDPESCHSVRIRVPRWQELAFFGGVQGFKNPYDIDRDRGNFGFHEGFNAGFKVPYTYIGYQLGYQAAQSQLNGTESPNSSESHTQHFTTLGLFRRTRDGLQFGSAWDTLVDRRHNARTFHQIRSEISWLDSCTHEFGFGATVGIMNHSLEEDEQNGGNGEDDEDSEFSWESADQYVLFYRVHGKRGGEGRFFAGWSDDSDGILGADMLLPVHDRWSVQTGFTYMIPDARDGIDGSREEAWNLNLAMVWHWGCTARTSHSNPYRPLFNVANNGSMIIDSRD